MIFLLQISTKNANLAGYFFEQKAEVGMELAVAILIQIFKKHFPEQDEQEFKAQLTLFFSILKRNLTSKLLIEPDAINLPGFLLLCFYFDQIIKYCQDSQLEIKFIQVDPEGNPSHAVALDKIHMLFLALGLALIHQDENFIFTNIYVLFHSFNDRKTDSRIHIKIIKELLLEFTKKFSLNKKLLKAETATTSRDNELKNFEEIYKFITRFLEQNELLSAELEKFIARSICNANVANIEEFIRNFSGLKLDSGRIRRHLIGYLISYPESMLDKIPSEKLDYYMLNEYPRQCLAIMSMLEENGSSFEINVASIKIIFDKDELRLVFSRIFSNLLRYLQRIGFVEWAKKLVCLESGLVSFREILNNPIFYLYFKMRKIVKDDKESFLDVFKIQWLNITNEYLEKVFENVLEEKQKLSFLEFIELYIYLFLPDDKKDSRKEIQLKVCDLICKYISCETNTANLIAILPGVELILKSQVELCIDSYKKIMDAFLKVIFLSEEITLRDDFDVKTYNENVIAVVPFLLRLLDSNPFTTPQCLEAAAIMEKQLKEKLATYIRDFVLQHPQEVSNWYSVYWIISYCKEVKDEVISTMVRRVKRLLLVDFDYINCLEERYDSIRLNKFQLLFLCYQFYIFYQAFTTASEDMKAAYYKMIINLFLNCVREIVRVSDKILAQAKLADRAIIDFNVIFKAFYYCFNKLISSLDVEIRLLALEFYNKFLISMRACLALESKQNEVCRIAVSDTKEQALEVAQANGSIIVELLMGTTGLTQCGDFSTFLEDMSIIITIFNNDLTGCEFLIDDVSLPFETFTYGFYEALKFLLQRLCSEELTSNNSAIVAHFLKGFEKLKSKDENITKPMEPLIAEIKLICWVKGKFAVIINGLKLLNNENNKNFKPLKDKFDKVISICFNFLRNNIHLSFDLALLLKSFLTQVPKKFRQPLGTKQIIEILDRKESILPNRTDDIETKVKSCTTRRFANFFPEIARDTALPASATTTTTTNTLTFGRS